MPKDITLAVRDIRSAVEDGVLTDATKAKLSAVLEAHDAERGVTRIENVRAESAEEQLEVVVKLLNRHIRRFPRTDCAMSLSLAGYLRGETSGEYLP